MLFSFVYKLGIFAILMVILALILLYFLQNKMLYIPGLTSANLNINYLVIPPL